MRKLIRILALIPLLALGTGMRQQVIFARFPKPAAGCSVPAFTYQWAVSNDTGQNKCGAAGTTLCANGLSVYTLVDSVAGNSAIQTTSANQPTFTTGAINGLPALTQTGSQYLITNTVVPGSTTQWTVFVVYKPASVSGGGSFFGGTGGNVTVWQNNTTVALGVVGTNNGYSNSFLSVGAWSAFEVTYNTSTGAGAFYSIAGGTATSQGTFAFTSTPGGSTQFLNYDYINGGNSGMIAEVSVAVGSTSVSGIPAYVACKYGL